MNLIDCIGRTPLIRLQRLETALDLHARIYAKLEMFNPFGSVKDRTALSLLTDPSLPPDIPIAEATSGNLGVSLAALAALLHHPIHLFMPDDMPPLRRALMQAYGATLHLTQANAGMKGALAALNDYAAMQSDVFLTRQFTNPRNPDAHFCTTGPEIAQALPGDIHHLVAGVGTGGTLTGTARYLLTHFPALHITAVEPAASPLLSGGQKGAHRLFGIGAGFLPPLLDTALLHHIIPVSETEAQDACAMLAKAESIFCGPSSGAALHAAIRIAAQKSASDQQIVVILPDSGCMYLTSSA